MLNEMFTGSLPHGTEYKLIGSVAGEFAFLDEVVAQMMRQTPSQRPQTVADLKRLLELHTSEAFTRQKLSQISETVIEASEVDEPLANDPPRLVGIDWEHGQLQLTLDRPVNPHWIYAFNNMGNYSSVSGKGPESFAIQGKVARVVADEHDVQRIVDFFKQWLPKASATLKQKLLSEAAQLKAQREDDLRREKLAAEKRLRILQSTKL
jgi:hypothetical protein